MVVSNEDIKDESDVEQEQLGKDFVKTCLAAHGCKLVTTAILESVLLPWAGSMTLLTVFYFQSRFLAGR